MLAYSLLSGYLGCKEQQCMLFKVVLLSILLLVGKQCVVCFMFMQFSINTKSEICKVNLIKYVLFSSKLLCKLFYIIKLPIITSIRCFNIISCVYRLGQFAQL